MCVQTAEQVDYTRTLQATSGHGGGPSAGDLRCCKGIKRSVRGTQQLLCNRCALVLLLALPTCVQNMGMTCKTCGC